MDFPWQNLNRFNTISEIKVSVTNPYLPSERSKIVSDIFYAKTMIILLLRSFRAAFCSKTGIRLFAFLISAAHRENICLRDSWTISILEWSNFICALIAFDIESHTISNTPIPSLSPLSRAAVPSSKQASQGILLLSLQGKLNKSFVWELVSSILLRVTRKYCL